MFPDKDALIQAAVTAALDPTRMLEDIASVGTAMPLRERLIQVTRILQRRLITVINLLTAVGLHAPPEDPGEHLATVRPTNDMIYAAVIRLLEPDRDRFDCSLAEVARLLRLLTFAGSHPLITDNDPLTAERIVSVLLDGVCRQQARP